MSGGSNPNQWIAIVLRGNKRWEWATITLARVALGLFFAISGFNKLFYVAGKFEFSCARAFNGESGDFRLENGDAGVGNFLAGLRVNDDEIRISDENEITGFSRFRYYDPTDCTLLDTVFVAIIE